MFVTCTDNQVSTVEELKVSLAKKKTKITVEIL